MATTDETDHTYLGPESRLHFPAYRSDCTSYSAGTPCWACSARRTGTVLRTLFRVHR